MLKFCSQNLVKNLLFNRLILNSKLSTFEKLPKKIDLHLTQLKMCSMVSSVRVEFERDEPHLKDKSLLRSASDKLDYKYLVLNNGLRALLVSDPTFANITDETRSDSDGEECSDDDLTDVSSCDDNEDHLDVKSAHNVNNEDMEIDSIKYTKKCCSNEKPSAVVVCVNAGSFDDPKEVPGLAHLVEHVLTMGSHKYPEENSLDDFLNSRGGYQNAHTEYEYTMYEIEVQRNHFYEALKRLAHCFISPLLRSESIDREIKPIDTEFCEALPEDDIRLEQLLCDFANADHPLNRFAWGNSLTLKTNPEKSGTNVQSYIKEFVRKHYVSNNIYVVVQSQESLETLEKWVNELFSQIKPSVDNKRIQDSPKPVIGSPFENNPNFNRLYIVEAVNEVDSLIISWCLPPVMSHYKTSPLDYLATIIGHEGKGSLISHLRKESLALELYAGNDESGFQNNRHSSMFIIGVKLTELGSKMIDKVVLSIFEYLTVLQTVGPQEWFFSEVKNIELNKFNWQEEQTAINYVKRLAVNLIHYPIEHVLCGNKLYFYYDKNTIQSYLNELIATKANFVRLCSNTLKADDKEVRKEQWMGTRFKVVEVPQKWLIKESNLINQSTRFHFPNPNPYIATDFKLKEISIENESLYPLKVCEENRLNLWYKPDNVFKHPKAIIKIHLMSRYFRESVESAVFVDLFIDILTQVLSEEVYESSLAGLDWSLTQTATGLNLNVNGFNHKLETLLSTILNKMINFDVEDKMFNDVKSNLSKSYHNLFIDPNNLNKSLRLSILCEVYFTEVEKRDVIQSIEKEMLLTFIKKVFSDFYIECLIQGNFTKEESIKMLSEIKAKIGINSQTGSLGQPILRITQIAKENQCCRVVSLCANNKNSSITNYYQISPANIRLQCLLTLLSSIMEEPCFNTLRTKEGLGYDVSCIDYDTFGISGLGVSVSSSGDQFDCTFIDERIEQFLTQMVAILSNMKESTFKQHITSIIKLKKSPDLQLIEEVSRNWSEILSFNYVFDRLSKEIKCLEKISFEEFKQWARDEVLQPKDQKRKLSVQVVGNGVKALKECATIDGKPFELMTKNEFNENEISNELKEKKFRLTYLRSKNGGVIQYNFISDIIKYKKSLNIFPNHKVIE